MAVGTSYLLVAFLGLFSYVNAAGWFLDSSCNSAAQQVRDSVNRAFTQAGDVVAELNKNPVDQDVLNLFNMIFENSDNMRNVIVKGVFQSIHGMRNELQAALPNDPSTVIVYCNQNRLQPHPSLSGFKWDTSILKQIHYTGENKKTIDECRSSNPINPNYTMAYTSNEPKFPRTASQVQICPWYLDHSFHRNFDQSKTYRFKRLASWIWERTFSKWKDTQIDAFADFTTTMLHEFSHTKEAGSQGLGGGTTNDVVGYGWKKIYAGRNNNAHHNADSYAYFGLGIRLMKDQNNPRVVTSEGKLVPRRAGVLNRRMMQVKEWFA